MKSSTSSRIALSAAVAVMLGTVAPTMAVAAPPAPNIAIERSLGATPVQLRAARQLGMNDQMLRAAAAMTDTEATQVLAQVEHQLAISFARVDSAATYDSRGRLVSIDAATLQRQYPNDPQLAAIIAQVNREAAVKRSTVASPGRMTAASADSFSKCFFTEALKGLGADVIKAMWGDNVRDAISKKAWGSVARIALQNIERKLGKKAAAQVAKFVASKFLPSGPVVGLAWVTAKCAYREF